MTVVDSSGWVEFFTDGPLAGQYAAKLRNLSAVLMPVIILYEVYKRLKRPTARLYHAELITSERDFESVPDVTYLPKSKA